jgi:hypothetical protein
MILPFFLSILQIRNDANFLVEFLHSGELLFQIFDFQREKMNFGPLLFCFVTQLSQFEPFFPHLDIVTEEENGGEETKTEKVKPNLKRLFVYSEVTSFGSLLAKDKNIEVIFFQNNLPFSLIRRLYWTLKNPI